ncbi:MAG: hypothetical protein O2865_06840 [Planctomycetota bacterium]|nr:hypothetical protein [Planctomycetota bacterium]
MRPDREAAGLVDRVGGGELEFAGADRLEDRTGVEAALRRAEDQSADLETRHDDVRQVLGHAVGRDRRLEPGPEQPGVAVRLQRAGRGHVDAEAREPGPGRERHLALAAVDRRAESGREPEPDLDFTAAGVAALDRLDDAVVGLGRHEDRSGHVFTCGPSGGAGSERLPRWRSSTQARGSPLTRLL